MKHHQRDSAHSKFQEIAFAYAILSDERRRKRYDTTGNTSESLEIEDDDFNWSDFFKAQWADAVTGQKINEFKSTYKHSEEERKDILSAYKTAKGDLDKIFSRVMLSNPLEDEDRFRNIINRAIAAMEVEAHTAFTHEKEEKKRRRHKRACGEGREADEYAKKLGVWDDLFGNAKNKTKPGAKNPDAALMEMIQKRKKGASSHFLENLEAKYGSQQQKGKKRKFEEPPEELFQKNRHKTQKMRNDEAEVDDDEEDEDEDEEVVDLEVDSSNSGSEDDNDEETVKPTKSNVNKANGSGKRKKANARNKMDAQDEEEEEPSKAKGDKIKDIPKKKKKDSAASATKVDDDEPTKSTDKGRRSRQTRSTRR